MILKFLPNVPAFEVTDLSKSYYIKNEQDEDIGIVEGYGNEDGALLSKVKIYNPKYQGKGIGFEAFNKIFDEIDRIVPVKKIVGSWSSGDEFKNFEDGMSTNLKVFLESSKTENEKNSAYLTPTGKWAQRLGFKNCEILSNSKDEVMVVFSK